MKLSPTINLLLLVCAALIIILACLTLMKNAHPATDESLAYRNVPDTLTFKEESLTILCFPKNECYLVDYKKLWEWAKKNDLTPKPEPSPIPQGIPTPQQ